MMCQRIVSRETFLCLALRPSAKSRSGAHVYAIPLVEPFEYSLSTFVAEVAGSHGMTSMHDLRAHDQLHVIATRLVVE